MTLVGRRVTQLASKADSPTKRPRKPPRAVSGLLPQPASDFDGVAIMLMPQDDDATDISPFAAVKQDDLHCTLAFLGDAAKLKAKGYTIHSVVTALATLQAEYEPIEATLGGMTRFSAPDNDPLVLNVDSKQVIEARARVLQLLGHIGLEEATDHGYTPHMTLGYLAHNRDLRSARWEPKQVFFDRIRIGFGGQNVDITLGGQYKRATRTEMKTFDADQVRGPDGRWVDTVMSVSKLKDIMMPNQLDATLPDMVALRDDIAANGVRERLHVNDSPRGAFLSDGTHRLLAAEAAGLTELPVRLFAPTEEGRWASTRQLNERERAKEEKAFVRTEAGSIKYGQDIGEEIEVDETANNHRRGQRKKSKEPQTVQEYRRMFNSVPTDEWGGGDVSISHELPDGRRVWLYGDTISANNGMPHSTALVQKDGKMTVSAGGKQLLPNGPTTADGRETIYWPDNVRQGPTKDTLIVSAMEMSIGTGGPWDFEKTNPGMSRESIVKVKPNGDLKFIKWTNEVMSPVEGNPHAEPMDLIDHGNGHVSYGTITHDIKLADGSYLTTRSNNQTDGFENHMLSGNRGLDWKKWRPSFGSTRTKALSDTEVKAIPLRCGTCDHVYFTDSLDETCPMCAKEK